MPELGPDAAVSAIELIKDVGLRRRIVDSTTIELAEPAGNWTRWSVSLRRTPPSPAQLKSDLSLRGENGILYVVPRASSYLREVVMSEPFVAFVDLDGKAVGLRGVIWAESARQVRRDLPPINRRRPWARTAVMRVLTLSERPMTQTELARACGVSQAAVSQSLAALADRAQKTPVGWEAAERESMWTHFMAQYRGPGGLASYWASLASPDEQLRRCVQAVGDDWALISGDWAADEYAPWRRPSRIVIYAEHQADLTSVLFGESDPSHSTIQWRVPADPTVKHTAAWYHQRESNVVRAIGGHLGYVDPLIAAWDVDRGTATDVIDAVEALRRHVVN